MSDVDKNIKNYQEQLTKIDNTLFTDTFEEKVKEQVNKFNIIFSEVSKNYMVRHMQLNMKLR